MTTTRLTSIYIIFLCLILHVSARAEYFQKIGLNEGLTQPSVMSITQDKLGRMWFGTLEGLNMFDGEKVTPYKGWVQSADSLIWLGNEIADLVSDDRGNL